MRGHEEPGKLASCLAVGPPRAILPASPAGCPIEHCPSRSSPIQCFGVDQRFAAAPRMRNNRQHSCPGACASSISPSDQEIQTRSERLERSATWERVAITVRSPHRLADRGGGKVNCSSPSAILHGVKDGACGKIFRQTGAAVARASCPCRIPRAGSPCHGLASKACRTQDGPLFDFVAKMWML